MYGKKNVHQKGRIVQLVSTKQFTRGKCIAVQVEVVSTSLSRILALPLTCFMCSPLIQCRVYCLKLLQNTASAIARKGVRVL